VPGGLVGNQPKVRRGPPAGGARCGGVPL